MNAFRMAILTLSFLLLPSIYAAALDPSWDAERNVAVASALGENQTAIKEEWESRVQKELYRGTSLAKPVLTKIIGPFLDRLGEAWTVFPVKTALDPKSHANVYVKLQEHSLTDVTREYFILGEVVLKHVGRHVPLSDSVAAVLYDLMDDGIIDASKEYHRLKQGLGQMGEGYLDIFYSIATEMVKSVPLKESLHHLLTVLSTATDASTATFVGHKLKDVFPRNAITIGVPEEHSEVYEKEIASSPLCGRVLDDVRGIHQENMRLLFGGINIETVIGIRIAGRGQILGTVFLGFAQPDKKFGYLELQQMDIISQRIAVYLDHAISQERARTLEQRKQELEVNSSRLEIEAKDREDFMAMLSHDLRTPLSVAMGNIHLLQKRTELPIEKRIPYLQRVSDNIELVVQRLDDSLVCFRFHAGRKIKLNIVQMNLSDLLRSVRDDLATLLGDRLVMSLEGEYEGFWNADAIRRIVTNLVENAKKHGNSEKEISILLGQRTVGEQPEVYFTVKNSGNGIPQERMATLFNIFEMGDNRTEGFAPGSGVGLSVVKALAVSLGGSVEVVSDPQAGTVFTVRLPMDSRPAQAEL